MKLITQIILFTFNALIISSCTTKSTLDRSLEIVGSDTTILTGGNFNNMATKFRMSDQNNFLMLNQGREIYWFDMEKDSIIKSVNLDTTQLVLPEVNMLQVLFQENDSSLILFFPQRDKIIHLNAGYDIDQEVDLNGIQDINHMYMPYGEVFFFDPKVNQYYVGMISDKLNDLEKFLGETRFVGVFDGNTGELRSSFGEFNEDRKKVNSHISSIGLINVGWFDGNFYLQETVGSSQIDKYDYEGGLLESNKIGTYFLSYDLSANSKEFESSHSFNEHNYGMALATSNRVVTMGVKFKDKKRNVSKDYGILFVEDLEDGICYSVPIDPFQKIIWASDSEIYLVRSHPKKDEMILVKLKYQLQKPD